MMRKAKPIFAALLISAFAACDDEEETTNPGSNTVEDTRESSRAYIDGIVPHHEMAVMMADEALAKAVHPSLKEMAQKMKEDQMREIGEFKQIRLDLIGSDTTPDPMEMKELPADSSFDKMFLHMMIDHHQGAIDQSILALDAGVSSPLDSLASHTIEAQRKEQKDMNDSLQAWYGETHSIGDGPHAMP